ncbi:hypothetical protein CR492_11025 [Methylocella silvestris]|uniref:Methyltransferase FkbM domain-containing protein n=1 Tax=Methylocella silvestris TaxID=199596 RepID=A0A2J7TGG1_METSI|nr:hypothetical protein CR492_11025 [Methylocella silvestris]
MTGITVPPKADVADFIGRFREIVSDPINLLVERIPQAGVVEDDLVWLHNGNRVHYSGEYAYYKEFSDILIINRGVHEPLEEYVFQQCLKLLPPRPTMLELGAYWAHYSMWLKRKHPDALVTMVEPDEANLRVGQRNFELNGFKGEFTKAFVGKGNFEVDPFFSSRNLTHLDILHADIQGFELEMLDGAEKTLSEHKVSYVFISTHSQELHSGVCNKLTALGYRVEVSSDFDFGTTSYDGMVFASSPSAPKVLGAAAPLGRSDIATSSPADLLARLTALSQPQKI